MTRPCPGHGGVVYTYEGPQFGSQTIEEPCGRCAEWHEPQSATLVPEASQGTGPDK